MKKNSITQTHCQENQGTNSGLQKLHTFISIDGLTVESQTASRSIRTWREPITPNPTSLNQPGGNSFSSTDWGGSTWTPGDSAGFIGAPSSVSWLKHSLVQELFCPQQQLCTGRIASLYRRGSKLPRTSPEQSCHPWSNAAIHPALWDESWSGYNRASGTK